jgi:hypothetical protein
MDMAPPVLNEAHAAFVTSGVSIVVAGRDAENLPTVVRAVGCRVSADRRRVTVFVPRSQAAELLGDLQANQEIAAVFSLPSTHRTIQLKSRDAALAPVGPADLACIAAQIDLFTVDIAKLGHAGEFARAVAAHAPDDLVGIEFTPYAAFAQTPGPRAGERLAV